MKVLYIAKHNSGGNDDEGAIAHALRQLGCEVVYIYEGDILLGTYGADFILFHHWRGCEAIRDVKIPKVFWCFDLIDWHDATISHRCANRREWVARATDVCDVGFMTDGDWVARDRTGKLHWLPQGFDERIQPLAVLPPPEVDILFTGIENGGVGRQSFVREMRERYRDKFTHVPKGCYGQSLSELIARAKIVVAPDAPITDRYWSNRVYNVLGRGGFLLHPYTNGLVTQYGPAELAMYQDRSDLHLKIEFFLKASQETARHRYGAKGRMATLRNHTYKDRCKTLLSMVKEKM